MNTICLWIGGIVVGMFALVMLWLLIEAGIAFVATCSFMTWWAELGRVHSTRRRRISWARAFFNLWWELLGHRNTGSTRWTNTNGFWNGIGDWKVWPKPEPLFHVYLEEPGDPPHIIEFVCYAETRLAAAKKAFAAYPHLCVSEITQPFDRAGASS